MTDNVLAYRISELEYIQCFENEVGADVPFGLGDHEWVAVKLIEPFFCM